MRRASPAEPPSLAAYARNSQTRGGLNPTTEQAVRRHKGQTEGRSASRTRTWIDPMVSAQR
jgi:hypothetical protein